MGPSRQRAGSRRLSRPARALIGLGLAEAGVASIGTQAQAGSKPVRSAPVHPTAPAPAGFASWKQVWAYQARLNAAAETILAAGDAGNASIVADPTRRELRVYWHGAVPATVRTTAGLLGVPVTFRAAAFTHRELVIDAKRLAEAGRVVSAAPATNGSGLAVTVDGAMGPAAQSRLRTRSSVPLFITPGTRPTASSTRQADTVPYWGGSRYDTVAGNCTNGIPVKVGGVAYMMTAAHCSVNSPSVLIPGQAARLASSAT